MYAMFLIAMVLPAVNLGIAAATKTAGNARDRAQAAILAQSKLSELIAGEGWQGGAMSGDFGAQWPNYRWHATITAWPGDTQAVGLQQLDVQIRWPAKKPTDSLTVSSLVYYRGQSSS